MILGFSAEAMFDKEHNLGFCYVIADITNLPDLQSAPIHEGH